MSTVNRHFLWYTDALSSLLAAAIPLYESAQFYAPGRDNEDAEMFAFITKHVIALDKRALELAKEAAAEFEWNVDELQVGYASYLLGICNSYKKRSLKRLILNSSNRKVEPSRKERKANHSFCKR